MSTDLPAWRIICLPGDRKSAFSIVTYPVPVHPFAGVTVVQLDLESMMLKMPSVGATASQMHWTMVLTCGYHKFVMFRLGQYPIVTNS